MKYVEVMALPGALRSSVAITLDMLEAANRLLLLQGGHALFSISSSGSNIPGVARADTSAGGSADIIVVPGLGFTSPDAVEAGLQRRDMIRARRRLVEAAENDAEIGASCTATFLLAEAGLLDARRATTTWWLAPTFRRRYPAVNLEADAIVLRDGRMVTAGAAMAHIDLMLALIRRHAGRATADACARYMLLDSRHCQSQYATLEVLAASDERVARAQAWARGRLEHPIAVEQLAAAAGLSPRTFARRLERVAGLSPIRFLQRLRIEKALELVETTRLPVEEVARRVGYAEGSTLRRLLRREGTSARAIRTTSSAADAAGR